MKKVLSILSVAALLIMSITLANAQTPRSLTVPMNAVGSNTVKGEAVLSEDPGGTKVVVTLTGFTPSQQSAGHIHSGKCDAQGPVVFGLSTITADAQGNGKSETVITPTLSSLISGTFYVQYHTAANPPGPQVSCGNIVVSQAVTTTAAATTAAATTAVTTTRAATTAAVTTTVAATTAPATTTAAATTTRAATTAAATTVAGTVGPAPTARAGGQGGAPGVPSTGIGGSTNQDGSLVWFLVAALLIVATGATATYAIARNRK